MGSQYRQSEGPSLKESSPGPQADHFDHKDREIAFLEFDGLSEQEVVRRVEEEMYDNRKSGYAREWLAHRGALRDEDNVRGLKARAQQAHDIALDCHRLVVEASSLARASDSSARDAKEIAQKAEMNARVSSKIATLALIVAALAIVAAIVVWMAR